jgi:hypothetical protein
MKDAPIEDRWQGNGNDEHKLPESIDKSAKKSGSSLDTKYFVAVSRIPPARSNKTMIQFM